MYRRCGRLGETMTEKSFYIIAVLVVLAAVCGYWVYYEYFEIYHGYTPLEFSSETWKNAEAEQRGYMLRDLEKKHELKGMDYKEIRELLGNPDNEHFHEGTKVPSGFTYNVGYMGFNSKVMMVFSYRFCISFDKNGKVNDFGTAD